jgi:hypothetical protein
MRKPLPKGLFFIYCTFKNGLHYLNFQTCVNDNALDRNFSLVTAICNKPLIPQV